MFDALLPIDSSILDFIQNVFKCGFMDNFMYLMNIIAYQGIIWVVLGVVLLLFRKTRFAGVSLLAALLVGFLVGDVALKHLIIRARPFVNNPDIVLNISAPSGSSFPSTHSCLAAAAATITMAKCHKAVSIPVLCAAVLIIFSRLYNYVHYPSDVIAGILLGIICAAAVMIIMKKAGVERKLAPRK